MNSVILHNSITIEQYIIRYFSKFIGFSINGFKFIDKFMGLIGLFLLIILLSPIIIIGYFFIIIGLHSIEKRLLKLKSEFLIIIKNSEYNNIVAFKKDIDKIYADFKFLKSYNSFRKIGFYKKLNSVENILLDLSKLCESSYKISADDFFENDEQRNEYIKATSTLNDIWKYKTSEADNKLIYNINKLHLENGH